ncbi:MAG: 50S ribosomal protein L17 [Thermotogaceae bacterium]|jgi:large subunit ribosomal protein L17|nr:50S ribosomal protein L17 [Thermotogota bacterium]NLZ13351.1 50S ribosomal protein L17 [Thermotogaceae bacterium]MDD8040188.1 50S ribosomal protein L17 [Thermotogota bacterium]MDD8052785.1 50S ribosomal protein L17 [Thermotogota bacterium]HNR63964.1 50S ribosomal protein L17 [Thermotogota bacterium]
MRHRNKINALSRPSDHRKALINNLIKDLIEHGSIVTTLPKAKAVRPYIEKAITKGKSGTVAARRHLYSFLQDRKLCNKVVDEISKGFMNRPGGYTRILKLGQRRGDAAEMAIIQFVKE